MDPRSEVLLRQSTLLEGNVLFAGLPADDLLAQFPNAQGWTWHMGDYKRLAGRYEGRSHFGTEPPARPYDVAVLFLPKSKALAEYLLARLSVQLAGKVLYVVGEKRGGIESAAKLLKTFGDVRKLDNARHCQLWQCRINAPAARANLEQRVQRYELALPDGPLVVVSLPGVFAHGRLDKGTELLLEHLDGLPTGPLLDFGCGAGVIGAWLRRRYPDSSVTLMDVDAFALEATRLTLAANGLEALVVAGSGIEDAPVGLMGIVSNPPFHQGVHTHYQASEDLLRQAQAHLQPHGELRIVANSFLRYPPLIEQHVGECRTLAERDGFRIYRAVRR